METGSQNNATHIDTSRFFQHFQIQNPAKDVARSSSRARPSVQSAFGTDGSFCEKVTTNSEDVPLWSRRTPLTNKHTSSLQLCGSTEPILGYLCWNGVSCTFEILILKPPLWLKLLRVSVGSGPSSDRGAPTDDTHGGFSFYWRKEQDVKSTRMNSFTHFVCFIGNILSLFSVLNRGRNGSFGACMK